MADYAAGRSIGARIAAARRSRGFRNPRDLAAAMEGSGITAAILENIESGRKVSLDVSHVLNIAKALGVPVSALLAPLGRPSDPLDLANLGSAFDGMTAAEFDSWLAGIPNADYTARSASERNDLAELHALRDLQVLGRERRRLAVADQLERDAGQSDEQAVRMRRRLSTLDEQITEVREFLSSAGWKL